MKSAKQITRQVAERLYPGAGCSDHGCVYGHSGGMGTNGGCACIKEEVVKIRGHLLRLSAIARTLATMVEEPGE